MIRRSDSAPTPKERLAARMREIIVKSYEAERHIPTLRFPNVPDIADLAEGIDLDVQRIILEAQIDAASEFRAFAFIAEKQGELNRVEFEIAKRNSP